MGYFKGVRLLPKNHLSRLLKKLRGQSSSPLLPAQQLKPGTGQKNSTCQKVMALMKTFWLIKKLRRFIFRFPIISILNGQSGPYGPESRYCAKNL